jgi:hypothetical protein
MEVYSYKYILSQSIGFGKKRFDGIQLGFAEKVF